MELLKPVYFITDPMTVLYAECFVVVGFVDVKHNCFWVNRSLIMQALFSKQE